MFGLDRLSRLGLVGAAVLMGAALLATVYSITRGVEDASDTLIRGQALTFRGAIRTLTRRRAPTKAEVVGILEQLESEGVRYIAVVSGGEITDAGELPDDAASIESWIDEHARSGVQRIGDRVRIAFARRPRRGRERPKLLIEFVPTDADALRRDARRGLAVGAVVAAALLLIAIALIRFFLRQETLERKLAHERRLASLGEMSAVLAHEIRNPIASLKGNAQLLVKMLPGEDRPRGKAERVVDEAERLERLTNDLLEFARSGEIERADVDPAQLLSEVAGGVDAEVEIERSGAPATWPLDGPRLSQVLGNLLDNAVAAGDGAPVTAELGVSGGALVVSIRDRGPGLEPGDLERVFEPFYTRKTRGTGLGLAVARRLVEGHGGTLEARNHPDGGAVFVATIPKG